MLGCKQLGLGLLGEDTSGPNTSIDAKSACSLHGQHPAEWPTAHNILTGEVGSQTRTRTQHRWHPRGWRPGPGVGHSCRRKANLSIASHNSEGIPSAGTKCETSHDGAQGSTFSWKTAISTPLTTRNLKKGGPQVQGPSADKAIMLYRGKWAVLDTSLSCWLMTALDSSRLLYRPVGY